MDDCQLTTSYCAGTWNWACLKVGYTYADEIEFTDYAGVSIDITGDDFEMIVKNSAGTVVDTLAPGSGLTIGVLNTLAVLIDTSVTGTAGTYTFTLVWTRPSTGENIPILSGKIVVA